ncbi:MAG: 2-oxoacid:acceptor oxidoreductase family protein [Chthoniobacteraceae bacterium]|nr:2-oxoacid:acceptor oxidoreductase family protein [Chthoniobacteraceae bacterium]
MDTINIKIAGLGGMGVLSASFVLAEAAFIAGYDVKKAEVHGMSQRGGSVASDIRFGDRVLSPMIPGGEVDYLVAIAPEWADMHRAELRVTGKMLTPADVEGFANKRALNVVLMGALSRLLPIPEAAWLDALAKGFPAKLHESNLAAFQFGREKIEPPTLQPSQN